MPLIAPAPLGSSSWLLRLRTFASIGQLVTILVARSITPTSLPIGPLLMFVALTISTNVVYGWWLGRLHSGRRRSSGFSGAGRPVIWSNEATAGRTHEGALDGNLDGTLDGTIDGPPYGSPQLIGPLRVAFCLMALDLITLTMMLYFSGGSDNPFFVFYFVNLAVGGVMLPPIAAWALTSLAVLGYTTLLITSWPVRGLSVQTIDASIWHIGSLSMRDVASLLAFIACSTVITYFVSRTSRQLRDREKQLRRSQSERADAMRLEGLTTLAAGAAHELATPLATIDIACRELARHLESVPKPPLIDEDLRLIDGQLLMCRQILSRMRSASGDAVADQWNRTTLGNLIDTTLEGIRDPHRVEIIEPSSDWPIDPANSVERPHHEDSCDGKDNLEPAQESGDSASWERQPMWLPEEAVAQAIRNLIHNALDASDSEKPVSVEIEKQHIEGLGPCVALSVTDEGQGMSGEVLDRAGEPFFTTKEPGRGIGLGLFLTRNVVTRLGGQLAFETRPGVGTRATIRLPLGSTEL